MKMLRNVAVSAIALGFVTSGTAMASPGMLVLDVPAGGAQVTLVDYAPRKAVTQKKKPVVKRVVHARPVRHIVQPAIVAAPPPPQVAVVPMVMCGPRHTYNSCTAFAEQLHVPGYASLGFTSAQMSIGNSEIGFGPAPMPFTHPVIPPASGIGFAPGMVPPAALSPPWMPLLSRYDYSVTK
jgi:hypothetical protein